MGIRERLAKLETKTDLFWGMVESNVPKMLVHPHSPRRDELLNKMGRTEFTTNEYKELIQELENDIDQEPKELRLAVILLLTNLKYKLSDKLAKEKKKKQCSV